MNSGFERGPEQKYKLAQGDPMRNRYFAFAVVFVLAALAFSSHTVESRVPAASTVPVHMVVTAEARHGTDVPVITREDVTVNQGRERVQVTDWVPLEGEHAALQLFVLMDDASGATLGAQLEDLRRFILSQPCDDVLDKLHVSDPLLDIAKHLEEAALKDPYFVERKLYPNVDFYSGIIMRAIGIPVEMFTVIFAIGRMPGWIANYKEVMEDKQSRIYRPRQIYTGPTLTHYTPIKDRK